MASPETDLIGPGFPIVDTHLHLYDPDRFTYGWLEGAPTLKHPHLPADYESAITPLVVTKGVFVEAAVPPESYLAETEWVSGVADRAGWLVGIVANASLENGAEVREDLDALHKNPLVRGIRRIVSEPFQTDPDFTLRPAFLEGVRLLAGYGFTFDLGIQRADLGKGKAVARQCPDVRFVVDHMANPDIRNGALEPWATDLKELAKEPNVYCKVSGMIPNAGPDWTVESLKPFMEVAIEAFGFDRVMFGSDWPVMDALGGSYRRWVDATCRILSGASERELRQFFHETGAKFYGI